MYLFTFHVPVDVSLSPSPSPSPSMTLSLCALCKLLLCSLHLSHVLCTLVLGTRGDLGERQGIVREGK
jgi:hypothetical protein